MFVCVSFFSYNFVCKLLTDWIKLSLLSDKTDNNIFVDDGVPAIMKDNHQHRNIYSNDKTHTKSHVDISERYSISVIYIVDIHLYFSSLVCLLNSTCQSCTMSLCHCLFSHLTAWPFGCPCSYFFFIEHEYNRLTTLSCYFLHSWPHSMSLASVYTRAIHVYHMIFFVTNWVSGFEFYKCTPIEIYTMYMYMRFL